MKDLLELIGQFLLEWVVYKVSEIFYGTQLKPKPKRRRRVARTIFVVLLIAVVAGFAHAANLPVPGIVEKLISHDIFVVFLILSSFFWALVVLNGESEQGHRNWQIGVVTAIILSVGTGISIAIWG